MTQSTNNVVKCKRIANTDRKGRSFYVVVSEEEVICSVPSGASGSNDLLAVLTALTRMISVALQNGVTMGVIKRQLKHSCVTKGDLPDLILRSIETWEKS